MKIIPLAPKMKLESAMLMAAFHSSIGSLYLWNGFIWKNNQPLCLGYVITASNKVAIFPSFAYEVGVQFGFLVISSEIPQCWVSGSLYEFKKLLPFLLPTWTAKWHSS